jgi:SAM-dependent methyltransferase
MKRLRARKLKLWSQDYLVYKYLWRDIELAIKQGKDFLYDESKKIKTLDVGCGNKPYRDLFDDCEYTGMDYNDVGAEPDMIGSAIEMPLDNESYDMVFSTQVIEHLTEPQQMVHECYRVLKPKGVLILTGPFYWPLHEIPNDYYRFSRYGFENLLKKAGFQEIEIIANGGTWAQIFLSISLQIPRWFFPLRLLSNAMGLMMDKLFYNETCPSNYTVIAKKHL